MLQHLSIKNFAIVKQLDVDFDRGTTAITGETGAGKSIAIDALGLCLGARADANTVRTGADKADITATFVPSADATTWLTAQELDCEGGECIVRRVISNEGRSKAYINGTPVALGQLKGLGQHLISIHGQNAHQQLLKADVQRQLLDTFAGHQNLLDQVSEDYRALSDARKRLQDLAQSQQAREDRRHLLQYQVSELDEFALELGEFEQLEVEFKRLSNSQTLLEQSQLSFHQLYEADQTSALSIIRDSVDRLTELQESDAELKPIVELLGDACIQVEEASNELRHYVDRLEIDPLKMQQTEARYAQAVELARKHRVMPEALPELHSQLAAELSGLVRDQSALDGLADAIAVMEQQYQRSAEALHDSRSQASSTLAKKVEAEIRRMNMAEAVFSINVDFDPSLPASKLGQDGIGFQISANPGQAPDRLEKVVSGGELSRIGLALQVIASQGAQVPTMIFDEVDTGISGPTASVVGQLLRRLGEQAQVMCVTHLPQVAACAHQQMFVTKFTDGESTQTNMLALDQGARVEELARLLAGDKLTESAIANARELLQNP